MRKMNRNLGQRIKQLEAQNFHMTSQGFNPSGLKHQEPSRPIFSGGYDAGQSPPRHEGYPDGRNNFQTPAQASMENNQAQRQLTYDQYDGMDNFQLNSNVESPRDDQRNSQQHYAPNG